MIETYVGFWSLFLVLRIIQNELWHLCWFSGTCFAWKDHNTIFLYRIHQGLFNCRIRNGQVGFGGFFWIVFGGFYFFIICSVLLGIKAKSWKKAQLQKRLTVKQLFKELPVLFWHDKIRKDSKNVIFVFLLKMWSKS